MTRPLRGSDILQLRRMLGYTQTDLARALGVSQAQVSHWERGRAVPGAEHLLRLAGMLRSASGNNPQADHIWPRSASTRPVVDWARQVSVGWKVLVGGKERLGFGEIVSYPEASGHVAVAYYQSPVSCHKVRVHLGDLRRDLLPLQTRCYFSDQGVNRIGRIVQFHREGTLDTRLYDVRLPNHKLVREVPETDFRVRSYESPADPVLTLALLAHETPFFFERRSAWVEDYAKQVALSHGLTGLLSAKVELFPHQLEVVRRVLQDPTIRYLLADEVGLGKTIEAGAILRQLRHDDPAIIRHRRVTTWLAAGGDAVKVKEAMGHADLRTTMEYTHLVRSNLRSLVEQSHESINKLQRKA